MPCAGRHPLRPAAQFVSARKVQGGSRSSAVGDIGIGNNVGMGREWEGDGKSPRNGGSGNGNGNEGEKKAIDRRSA